MSRRNVRLCHRQTCPAPERAPASAFPLAEAAQLYRVYEATDPFHPEPFRLAVSQEREARLFADIDCGRCLVRLGSVVLETREQALARTMAEALFL